jgi:hypothetical protein
MRILERTVALHKKFLNTLASYQWKVLIMTLCSNGEGSVLQAYQVTKTAFPMWIFFAIILIKHNEQENFQSVWVYQ